MTLLLAAIIFSVLVLLFFKSHRSYSDLQGKLEQSAATAANVKVCKLSNRYNTGDCDIVDVEIIRTHIQNGDLSFPPSKVAIKREFLIVFTATAGQVTCYRLIEYENTTLPMLINDIVPTMDCSAVEKYIGAYYEISVLKDLREE